MKRIALFAGSFDPITNGHMDVLRQALALADEIIVAIGVNPKKTPMFSFEERQELIAASIADLVGETAAARISTVSYSNLLVETARQHKASILVRGLRDGSDLDDEIKMASMNAAMAGEVQTVFIPASPQTRHINATLVRQIANMGGDVTPFVPQPVAEALRHKK